MTRGWGPQRPLYYIIVSDDGVFAWWPGQEIARARATLGTERNVTGRLAPFMWGFMQPLGGRTATESMR